MTGNKLMDCPSCLYSEEKYKENRKRWGACGAGDWDCYKPVSYKSKLTGQWVIYCNNCDTSILFNQPEEEDNITLWNDLSTKVGDLSP